MLSTANKLKHFKSLLKQNIHLHLKPIKKLENINIFAIPSRIQDKDILAMFKGVLALMREKVEQEQTEKYLKLKLKYSRLKYLYYKNKRQHHLQ